MPTVLMVANKTLAADEVSEFVKSRMTDDAATKFTLLVLATANAHPEQIRPAARHHRWGSSKARRCASRGGSPRFRARDTDSSSGWTHSAS